MVAENKKEERQAVTLSLDKDTCQKYQKFCKDQGWVLSAQADLLIEKHIEEILEGKDGN